MGGVISITTDFGLRDPYVGIMKGVILSINPGARIVDITNNVPSGEITAGALALESACRYFPPETIHLAVVDPGVGTSRKPIAVETENFLFVGPDNGLLYLAARADGVKRIFELTNREYFLERVSATFHGRDIFSPVAAHLSLGVPPERLGPESSRMVELDTPRPTRVRDEIIGRVVMVDVFGNLITNISRGDLPQGADEDSEVAVKGVRIHRISRTYGSVGRGGILCLFGSTGRLEVAANGESASRLIGAGVGEPVVVKLREGSGMGFDTLGVRVEEEGA